MSRRTATRTFSRAFACLPFLAALTAARPAAADDPKPFEVTIAPRGQSWSIGSRSGGACEPFCTLRAAGRRAARLGALRKIG